MSRTVIALICATVVLVAILGIEAALTAVGQDATAFDTVRDAVMALWVALAGGLTVSNAPKSPGA